MRILQRLKVKKLVKFRENAERVQRECRESAKIVQRECREIAERVQK